MPPSIPAVKVRAAAQFLLQPMTSRHMQRQPTASMPAVKVRAAAQFLLQPMTSKHMPRQPTASMQAGKVRAAAISWRMPPSIHLGKVLAADSRTIHLNGTLDDRALL